MTVTNIHRNHSRPLTLFVELGAPNQRVIREPRYHFGVLLSASASLVVMALEVWLAVSLISNFSGISESPDIALECTGRTITMGSVFFSWSIVTGVCKQTEQCETRELRINQQLKDSAASCTI
jgi:hypothetical protein